MKSPDFSPSSTKPLLARRNSSYFKNTSLFRSRKQQSPTADTFSPSDAQWFLRLPDKVQQKHFTREERLALSGQADTFIPDAADQQVIRGFFEQGREANRSVPTLSHSSSASNFSSSSKSSFEIDLPVYSAEDMDDSAFEGFRWIEHDDDHDLASTLRLDDYHEFMNQAVDAKSKPSRRKPSFRRTLSLSSLPFGSNSFGKPDIQVPPPLPSAPLVSHQRNSSFSSTRPATHLREPSFSSINAPQPAPMHYNDPSARLKLRVYLASPQKFDEAIEFGFPSMDDKDVILSSRQSIQCNSQAGTTTFLYDDASLLDTTDHDSLPTDSTSEGQNDEDETVSLPDRSSPYTPIEATFPQTLVTSAGATETYLHSPSEVTFSDPSKSSSNHTSPLHSTTNSSMMSTLFPRPTIRHNYEYDDPYCQALSGGREMTLRMTLTRPDLRADEKVWSARPHASGQRHHDASTMNADEDPLALEHLPLSDDIWDTLPPPKEKGVFKRVWRKVSGKGS